jgi:hypothetical protein
MAPRDYKGPELAHSSAHKLARRCAAAIVRAAALRPACCVGAAMAAAALRPGPRDAWPASHRVWSLGAETRQARPESAAAALELTAQPASAACPAAGSTACRQRVAARLAHLVPGVRWQVLQSKQHGRLWARDNWRARHGSRLPLVCCSATGTRGMCSSKPQRIAMGPARRQLHRLGHVAATRAWFHRRESACFALRCKEKTPWLSSPACRKVPPYSEPSITHASRALQRLFVHCAWDVACHNGHVQAQHNPSCAVRACMVKRVGLSVKGWAVIPYRHLVRCTYSASQCWLRTALQQSYHYVCCCVVCGQCAGTA